MTDKERESLNNEEDLTNNEPTGDNTEHRDELEIPTPIDETPASVEKEEEVVPSAEHKADKPLPAAAPVPVTPAAPSSNSNKIWMVVSLVLAVILVIVLIKPPFGAGSGGGSTAVATVNGVDIKKDKLYNALIDVGGPQTLDSLITEELVNQEADKKNIKITEADITKEMDDIKKGFNSDTEFQQALAQSNMTEEDLKKQMNMQVQIRKLLEPDVKVSDDDIKKYFDENKASFDTPEQVKASHILVKTKEEAQAILKQLQGGADFATLAKEKSIDPGSKDNGGDLGLFGRGEMEKSFEDAAFKLEPGKLSDIVQSSNGYHIIKVAEHNQAKKATLDEKKADIKELLISQAINTKAPTWLADIKAKSKITNTLDDSAAADAGAGTTTK